MATITTGGSGNWSSTTNNAPWPGGTLPASTDDVVIANGHTVTLDTTTAVALTVTVNGGGVLTCSTSGSSKLTTQSWISGANTASPVSRINLDMSSCPQYTCEIRVNNGNNNANAHIQALGDFDFIGASKTPYSYTTAALTANSSTSVEVEDCTGWLVGDKLCFATTQAWNSTARVDLVTIATITPTTGAAATISWTDGAGTGGAVLYDHADNCMVGNFTRNLIIGPAADGYAGQLFLSSSTRSASDAKVEHVMFDRCKPGSAKNPLACLSIDSTCNIGTMSGNAFYLHDGIGTSTRGTLGCAPVRENNLYLEKSSTFGTAINHSGQLGIIGDETSPVVFRSYSGIKLDNPEGRLISPKISGCTLQALQLPNGRQDACVIGGGIWGSRYALYTYSSLGGVQLLENLRLGIGPSSIAVYSSANQYDTVIGGSIGCVFQSCYEHSSGLSINAAGLPTTRIAAYNRNGDSTKQDVFQSLDTSTPSYSRATDNVKGSISSLKMSWSSTRGEERTQAFTLLAASGVALTIKCWVRKSSTYSGDLPSVTVSGLGITPIVAAMSLGTAADTWELLTLSVTQNSGADGLLTMTLKGRSTANGSYCWFSGLPCPPFVTRCRHYGYLFDETIPTRTINPVIVANESTAIAYTGVTIDSSTPKITVASGTANTFQKVHDYIQAWACENVDKAVLFTSTDGINFNVPLTCKVDWAGMSNDGTLAGGWLLLGSAGTYSLRLSGTKIDFTAAGTYNMSGTVFSGTVELVNSSGGAVTVSVPTGTSYTNTGPNITVTEPVEGYGLSFSGLLSGSTITVFETGTTTVIDSEASSGTTWQWDTTGAGETVDYTILKDGYTPIRVTGVVLTDTIVPVAIQQTLERAYIASSGLTFGTNTDANPATKKFDTSTASTIQNYYSHMLESWRTEPSLANVAFPIVPNGPNSFSLIDGWEFTATSIPYLSRDGLRYVSTGGTQTAVWAALLSVGTSEGMQVRYQQSDGGTTGEAATTGPIDELIQIYGDSTHGNFDYRGYLKLKVQADGYDEANADAIATYGTLEDQLYIVGLAPLSNGLATGDPSVTGVTITDHGASPVTWNGKSWSITITDSGTNSGTAIMRWLRYNFAQGGTFQSKDAFNWHDLVQVNGSKFKSIRGPIYGDTGASLKGVRVLRGTAPHPDFDLMTADDGTTYAPPPTASVTITGAVTGSRVQLYDMDANEELLNSATPPFTWSETYSADREIRLRVMQADADSAKLFVDTIIGTITESSPTISYLVDQDNDAVYAANAIDGSLVTGITIDDNNLLINIDDDALTWATIYAYETYWLTTEEGIRDEGRIIDATDTANYRFHGFKIKNVGAGPLVITGGYGIDAATNTVAALFDTSGQSIFPAPDHVVAYQLDGGEVEPGISQQAAMRVLLSVAVGKTTITPLGADVAEVVFRDVNDTTDRISALVSGSERTDVTLDTD